MTTRRAFLVGLGAAGVTVAALPVGASPYPVPERAMPDGVRGAVIPHAGVYMVILAIGTNAKMLRFGLDNQEIAEYRLWQPDPTERILSIRYIESMAGARAVLDGTGWRECEADAHLATDDLHYIRHMFWARPGEVFTMAAFGEGDIVLPVWGVDRMTG